MFEALLALEKLKPSMEAQSPEQQARKREFLESRIERRWNFNKNSPNRSKKQLASFETAFEKIKKKISGKTFNEEMFESLRGDIQMVDSTLMISGLEQITKLAQVFEEICSKPPSNEQTNLTNFKSDMVKILKTHAPAYSYKSYKVYASFVVDKSLIKSKVSIKKLGYDKSFIETTEKALKSVSDLIETMVKHEDLIHKLGSEIVEVLMGPKASDYIHARRGFELVNTIFTSILTIAPYQYISVAMAISNRIANCYS